MLTWEQADRGWAAGRYRIELVAPYQWVLLEDVAAPDAVRIEPTPLAQARTLSQCKREAELLDTATRVAEVRRRSWGKLILAVLGLVFVPTLAAPWDLFVLVGLMVAAARTVGFLAGSYFARYRYTPGELFYQ